MLNRWLQAWVLMIGVASTSIASAQANAPAAEALFRAGRQALRRGDAQAACEKFRESYRIEAAVGTLLNIAICEEASGELASAWQHYQEVVHALEPNDERANVALEHLSALDPRVPRLTIVRAPGMPGSVAVWIGDVELRTASFNEALPLDVGPHAVVVKAAGHADARQTIELREGERRVLEVNVGDALSAPATAPQTPVEAAPLIAPVRPVASRSSDVAPRESADDERGGGTAVVGVVMISVASASLIASGVTTALWADRAATVHDHCDAQKRCDETGLQAAQEGQTLFVTSLVTLAGAIVGGGVGAYLWFSAGRQTDEQAAWSVTPNVSARQVGVHVASHF